MKSLKFNKLKKSIFNLKARILYVNRKSNLYIAGKKAGENKIYGIEDEE